MYFIAEWTSSSDRRLSIVRIVGLSELISFASDATIGDSDEDDASATDSADRR